MTATGISIGLVAAVALARLIASQMYGVSATDPLTYAVATIAVSATALLAIGIPAVRASQANVTNALRYE